jgi:hypothetical protein
MIQNTLKATQDATFAVLVPHRDPAARGFPTPNGTAFFISKDGYVLTARHVLFKDNEGTSIHNAPNIMLEKPENLCMISNLSIAKDWPNLDLVLLKANFDPHKEQPFLKGKTGFDFLQIDFTVIPEGTPVYAFGYPLANIELQQKEQLMVGFHFYCPRTTSAVISSHYDVIGPSSISGGFPPYYVIDKALNYGNSGGPIIVEANGKAISVCQRFQPVGIPQGSGNVTIPSLYGFTRSLKNVEADLRAILGI